MKPGRMNNTVFKMSDDRYTKESRSSFLYQIWKSIFSNIGWTQCHTIMMHVESENTCQIHVRLRLYFNMCEKRH